MIKYFNDTAEIFGKENPSNIHKSEHKLDYFPPTYLCVAEYIRANPIGEIHQISLIPVEASYN